jgi:tRNA modification GTPase
MRDMIFALATAPGRAAVAVMRVSGPDLSPVVAALVPRPLRPREAALRAVRGVDGHVIDRALVLWFPGPRSFTGEDVLELHLHGGAAVVEAASEALRVLGVRPAEPGEFTRRAFEAGRLDLSEAEAVADLVEAETQAQRRQALEQLGGALARRAEAWRGALLEALAFLEAQVDFPDEEVPEAVAAAAEAPLRGLIADLDAALQDRRGERVRQGLRIALIGAPNAGKSSLFNALIGRDAAIVTPIAGTTRDVIEASAVIGGYKVTFGDTAGLRSTDDVVEAEGVRRAKAWAEAADLRLWLVDPSAAVGQDAAAGLVRPGDFRLMTKADLWTRQDVTPSAGRVDEDAIPVSVTAAGGLDRLRLRLNRWVTEAMAGADFPAVTQLRHREVLTEARAHLARALDGLRHGAELAAEDVRLAARALERLTGRVNPDDVLDRVFASFCIGK